MAVLPPLRRCRSRHQPSRCLNTSVHSGPLPAQQTAGAEQVALGLSPVSTGLAGGCTRSEPYHSHRRPGRNLGPGTQHLCSKQQRNRPLPWGARKPSSLGCDLPSCLVTCDQNALCRGQLGIWVAHSGTVRPSPAVP